MTLIQELMNQSAAGVAFQPGVIKRFSAQEIRESIQVLVASEQIDMAFALGDAGFGDLSMACTAPISPHKLLKFPTS